MNEWERLKEGEGRKKVKTVVMMLVAIVEGGKEGRTTKRMWLGEKAKPKLQGRHEKKQ